MFFFISSLTEMIGQNEVYNLWTQSRFLSSFEYVVLPQRIKVKKACSDWEGVGGGGVRIVILVLTTR